MSSSEYMAVAFEGAPLPRDLIARIVRADSDLPGHRPEDYHLAASERLGDAASRSWEYLLGAYRNFRERLDRLPDSDAATSLTRERWLLILLRELGYGQVPYVRGGLRVADRTYPISHCWQHVPMNLLGWRTELDVRSSRSTRAPQPLVQEFLNVSDDHLWGVLSNGRLLRVLRDSSQLIGASYVEFNLEAIFEGEIYSEFLALFALLHVSRLELHARPDADGEPTPADCWLERWRTEAIETGSRARKQLRQQVARALEVLGNGFLTGNPSLVDALRRGPHEPGGLSREEFLHELLRLAYQLIFLFVAEDRAALLDPDAPAAARRLYAEYFSTARLRRIARRRRGDRHGDLWRALIIVLHALGSEGGRPEIGIKPLGGLFFHLDEEDEPHDERAGREVSPELLRGCELRNEDLLEAVRLLTSFRDRHGRAQAVDYKHLGADELGSVYESLLELVPRIEPGPVFFLEEVPGNRRKTSGSYYTPAELIEKLLDTALDPVIDQYAAAGRPDDLLKITVCDPACGSGDFLVAAARRIAKRYAALYTGEDQPAPHHVRQAMAKVVRNCIYGVDINPLAADLAKISLWMESLEPGKPLAFLDAHIRVGNSLLGTTPRLLEQGVPAAAFKPIEGDDPAIAKSYREQNEKELSDQLELGYGEAQLSRTGTEGLVRKFSALTARTPRDLAGLRAQAQELRWLENSPDVKRRKQLADAWCAAFVWPKTSEAARPVTTATLKALDGDETIGMFFGDAVPTPEMLAELRRLTGRYGFFHWHLEFPEVFRVEDDDAKDFDPETGWQGGFSCVVGNPPWERVKLQEKEFFASRNEEIATARNAAERKKKIEALADSEDSSLRNLYADFRNALRTAAGWSHLLRDTDRYPLTGHGDINTYSVFAETARTVIGPTGRSGLVLPTGIATDATTAPFFGDVVRSGRLAGFLEFENEEFLLSRDVHHSFRFCLISVAGRKAHVDEARFAFGSRRMSDVPTRTLTMPPEDILLLNPNTGTAPLFRSRRDAQITLDIYRRVPVLWRETPRKNPWNLSFMAMFHMANDSDLFHAREELESEGWSLTGNIFVRDGERMLPLYEAKMIHHYDHRYGTYEGQTEAQANMGTLPRLGPDKKDDPRQTVLPRYWVPETEVEERLKGRWDRGWLLGWRDIARSTDDRTMICGFVPRVAIGHKFPLALTESRGQVLAANLSSLVLDYVVRQKYAGTSMTYFVLKQLPVLEPEKYEMAAPWAVDDSLKNWVENRVLELSYTAWDMEAFARDLGDRGAPFVWDEGRRFVMRAELDAAYFHLYGVERDDVEYIMDSFQAFRNNDPERFERTKSLICRVYDAMRRAMDGGEPYETIVDPPPGRGPRHPAHR